MIIAGLVFLIVVPILMVPLWLWIDDSADSPLPFMIMSAGLGVALLIMGWP